MADCYITEFENGVSGNGSYLGQYPAQPPLARQKITIGANTQSAAFNSKTKSILIVADGACHYAIGSDPTASSTTDLLPANVPLQFGVNPGDKIAVAT